MASLYALVVMHEGSPSPTETVSASRASEVLNGVAKLLARHPDCHRIRVESMGTLLFAVDCEGKPVDD